MEQTPEVPIVLVDDDPDEHFLFECFLADAGFVVQMHPFIRVDAALAFLNSRAPTPVLVLTDLSLPGCDPIQFLEESAKLLHGGLCGVFSGTQDAVSEAEARAAGASFYLKKPISWEAFLSVIEPAASITMIADNQGKHRLISQ
ncbi:MAG: response regulator [Maricaulis sp.]|jgi:DNA-binding NtrC family response regulator|nr:response regulator [Maricaulis sp.]MDG2044904.1 response regulator [Maricaulis sp.]